MADTYRSCNTSTYHQTQANLHTTTCTTFVCATTCTTSTTSSASNSNKTRTTASQSKQSQEIANLKSYISLLEQKIKEQEHSQHIQNLVKGHRYSQNHPYEQNNINSLQQDKIDILEKRLQLINEQQLHSSVANINNKVDGLCHMMQSFLEPHSAIRPQHVLYHPYQPHINHSFTNGQTIPTVFNPVGVNLRPSTVHNTGHQYANSHQVFVQPSQVHYPSQQTSSVSQSNSMGSNDSTSRRFTHQNRQSFNTPSSQNNATCKSRHYQTSRQFQISRRHSTQSSNIYREKPVNNIKHSNITYSKESENEETLVKAVVSTVQAESYFTLINSLLNIQMR